MLPLILFGIAVLAALIHLLIKKQWRFTKVEVETFLAYLIFFNIGVMGLLAVYAHTFMADETALSIGWPMGNPFQSEIAVANLAFGVLGILALWFRGLFWLAVVLGNSIFLIGAFFVHIVQFWYGDSAPYNIGIFVWVGDLLIPIVCLALLKCYMHPQVDGDDQVKQKLE